VRGGCTGKTPEQLFAAGYARLLQWCDEICPRATQVPADASVTHRGIGPLRPAALGWISISPVSLARPCRAEAERLVERPTSVPLFRTPPAQRGLSPDGRVTDSAECAREKSAAVRLPPAGVTRRKYAYAREGIAPRLKTDSSGRTSFHPIPFGARCFLSSPAAPPAR